MNFVPTSLILIDLFTFNALISAVISSGIIGFKKIVFGQFRKALVLFSMELGIMDASLGPISTKYLFNFSQTSFPSVIKRLLSVRSCMLFVELFEFYILTNSFIAVHNFPGLPLWFITSSLKYVFFAVSIVLFRQLRYFLYCSQEIRFLLFTRSGNSLFLVLTDRSNPGPAATRRTERC